MTFLADFFYSSEANDFSRSIHWSNSCRIIKNLAIVYVVRYVPPNVLHVIILRDILDIAKKVMIEEEKRHEITILTRVKKDK